MKLFKLLPALPKGWLGGSVPGLKTRGGFRVSLTWKSGQLTAATLESTGGHQTQIRYHAQVTSVTLEPGKVFHWKSS